MSSRGKRFTERKRILEKRSLVQERAVAGIHNRGFGGRYRYQKRRDERKRLEEMAERSRSAAMLLEKAEAMLAEAALYEPWSPEEAQKLRDKAAALREEAAALRGEEKEADKEEVYGTRKEKARARLRAAYASSRTYSSYWSPSRSYAAPKRLLCEPDPQIKALSEAIRSGETNFMGGISYRINPVDTLKMISASSIFGEPQYYRDGSKAEATILDGCCGVDRVFARYSLAMMDHFRGMKTSQVMEKAVDDALDEDFDAVLKWAVELRTRYYMRLNPQVIMVRAAMHPGRAAYTRNHPGVFANTAMKVMCRGDDVIGQAQYWLGLRGSKNKIPAVLKRSWAKRIGSMDAYSMAKYQNSGIGLVDVVRICHAKGELVDLLMRRGKVPMPEGENTWERLRASGMGWGNILKTIRMPHMALLRNLRGIFSEVRDPQIRREALALLKDGVLRGKQFPFRYLSAWKAVKMERRPWSRQVLNALEECMGIACGNLPRLKGRCAFLTDNSGSAWGTCPSEWGSMKIAEIGNLSSVIGAMCADEGTVFPFGDNLEEIRIRKDEGVLKQAHQVSALGKNCGMSTENGIWLFFRDALMQKQHWDNIFVYSDMQAGHGGLYGIKPEDYEVLGARLTGRYIDVNMLVKLYRQYVNPKVNVFCIQTAGYTNVLVPEYGYRTAVLYGWTGRELIFAGAMNRIWDELEKRKPEQ